MLTEDTRVDVNTSPAAEPQSGEDKPTPKQEPDSKELQRQLEHTRQLLQQEQNNSAYWHKRATSDQPAPVAPVQPTREEEFDTASINILDAVAQNDMATVQKLIQAEARKLVKAELKNSGYVSKQEVDQLVNQRAQEMQTGMQLTQQFPDLLKPESPLAVEAGRQLELLDRNPAYQNLPDIEKARLAATFASNQLYQSGQIQQQQPEPSRFDRIAAQQGSFGGGQGAQSSGESSDLTPSQKAAAARFGVSEESYKKSLKVTKIVGMGQR